MSKGKTPQYPMVTAPTVATGSDLYNQAQNFYQQNYPSLLSAQSNALQNANDPNYYQQFQPTSFEQALGNQQFNNIWPDEQALIKQQLSQSGLEYSPVLAETSGRAYGNLATGIGEYLNNQGNTRATNAIQAGMNINPSNLLNPYAQLGAQQSNQQGQFNMNAQEQNAGANYANQVQNYNQSNAMTSGIGSILGGGAGFALGGPAGAMIGSGFGSALGGGGGQGMSNSLLASQYMPNSQPFGGMFSGSNNSVNIPGMGSQSTNGMSFSGGGDGYSNTANIFGNGAMPVYSDGLPKNQFGGG